MADCKLNSLVSQVQFLIETRPDFPQRLKQRLVLELNKMENHFQFILGLLSKGVLCDQSTDSEANFGIKEIMAQLAIMIACTKGADQIGGLMKSLEESGNPELVSALETWFKEDFGLETDADLRRATEDIATAHTSVSVELAKQMKSPAELTPIGTKLIDKVMAKTDKELLEQLEGHLIGKASKIVNAKEFFSSLARQNVLDGNDVELKSGSELQDGKWTEEAIKAACSKRAIGSLILALQNSNNEHVLEETLEWLDASQAREKNYPIAVKSLVNHQTKEEPKVVKSTFFEQAALPDALSKLATFKCEQKSATKGISAVQFDKERMIACSTDGTLHLRNWRSGEEQPINIAAQMNNVTCFQYDEEILILGTSHGGVHLFDARTYEEKSSLYLGDPVTSLKFVESTLVVFTRNDDDKVWWVYIARSHMLLLNPRNVNKWEGCAHQVPGICMYPDTSILYYEYYVFVYDTKSGNPVVGDRKLPLSFAAPYEITTLNVSNFVSTERVIVAGCANGTIVMWNTSKLTNNSKPVKCFRRHRTVINGVCAVGGHLVSLDRTGKLLMWSGYDLENESIREPVPRVLAKNFSKVSNLAAYERWFASGSSRDGTINVWTLSDLWLHPV